MAAAVALAGVALAAAGVSLFSITAAAIAWKQRDPVDTRALDLKGLHPIKSPKLDVTKYSGVWFEQCRMDSWFERGLSHTTAEYTLRADGMISVLNCGKKVNGSIKSATGQARLTSTNGVLQVSFFAPFEGLYVILYLDEDYTISVVGSTSRKLLWLLTRNRIVTSDQLRIFGEVARANGYNEEQMKLVKRTDQSV